MMTRPGKKLLSVCTKVIKDSRVCSLTTIGLNGFPRTRLMGTFVCGKEWEILFVCLADSNKIQEIACIEKTQVLFWSVDYHAVVSLSGVCALVQDKTIRRRIYRRTAPLQLFPVFNDTFAVIRFKASCLEYLNLMASNKAVEISI